MVSAGCHGGHLCPAGDAALSEGIIPGRQYRTVRAQPHRVVESHVQNIPGQQFAAQYKGLAAADIGFGQPADHHQRFGRIGLSGERQCQGARLPGRVGIVAQSLEQSQGFRKVPGVTLGESPPVTCLIQLRK